MEPLISAKDIRFRYIGDNGYLLDKISLELNAGEAIGIMGPSGSGKSTLLQILNGIIPKRINGELWGELKVMGKDINAMELYEIAPYIGTIFQDPDCSIIYPCVEDEIAFGPENLMGEPNAILADITRILLDLNISELRYSNPNELSGGQKQLIQIASVLSLNVNMLFLDECMAWLDSKGKTLLGEALRVLKGAGKGIIMIEHDYSNLRDICDRVYKLENGRILLED